MEIRKYTYVDIHYNNDEFEKANKEQKRLFKLGYTLESPDKGSVTDHCDQYLRYSKFIKK